jgi:AcrR family transcriptional regulator
VSGPGLTAIDWPINNEAMTTSSGADGRTTADERREQVLDAAIHEFAVHGLHAAKTAAIARRAGISQPYIYALFDDKKALFIACQERVRALIKDAFTAAWRPAGSPDEALRLMGGRYRELLVNPDAPRCQLQGHAASADPEIREHMRGGFLEVFDLVQRLTGADRGTVARFMATGMLLNLGSVLELPEEYVSAAFADE